MKKVKCASLTPDSTQISIIGHRGAGARSIHSRAKDRAIYPENSLIGFREIMKSGADGIEFDLILSHDKKLMVVHDDDLGINCFGIVTANISKQKDLSDVGVTFQLEKQKFFVSKYECLQLQAEFDISMNFDTSKISKEEKVLYTKMPEFTEVLKLVSIENEVRAREKRTRVKLNIELKGPGTGELVEAAIKYFNDKNPDKKILPTEIYYVSFIANELLSVLKHNPKANIFFGVPTKMQYANVDQDYNIEDVNFNYEGLKALITLNNTIKATFGRNGRGLDGVDMSIWDVSDKSIEFFCKDLKIPIHLAIVPFSLEDLKLGYIIPVLSNYWKIIYAQYKAIIDSEDITIFVKTDEPIRLKEFLLDARFNPNNEREIVSVERFDQFEVDDVNALNPVTSLETGASVDSFKILKDQPAQIPLFHKCGSAKNLLVG